MYLKNEVFFTDQRYVKARALNRVKHSSHYSRARTFLYSFQWVQSCIHQDISFQKITHFCCFFFSLQVFSTQYSSKWITGKKINTSCYQVNLHKCNNNRKKSPEIDPFSIRVNQKFTFGFTVNAKRLTRTFSVSITYASAESVSDATLRLCDDCRRL